MSFRYRLCPDEAQEQMMVEHCGQTRLVWNLALDQMNIAYAMGLRCDWKQWERELAELRNEPGLEWLRDGSSSVQQQALRHLRKAWTDFFKNPSHFGRPKFRAKHRTGDGFVVRDVRTNKLNKHWSQVHAPKVGWVKFRTDRRRLDKHGMAHVTRDKVGRWHVSFSAPQPAVEHSEGWEDRSVGVDRGASRGNTIATSDREMLGIPLPTKEENNRLKRKQRKSARQQPGSNRRETTKKQIAKLHGRFAARRKDWVEKTSSHLVKNYELIVFEDLRTKQMMKSASGTVENPGRGVAAKSALNKMIAESSWGMLERRTIDKAEASGVTFVKVPAQYTSQRCSECGHTEKGNRPKRAIFECLNPKCGHKDHADFNSAKVILAEGLYATGRGGNHKEPCETSTAPERLAA